MTSIHSKIQKKCPNALVSSCKRVGCKAVVDDIEGSSISIIDCDLYAKIAGIVGRICDFIVCVTGGNKYIALLEMKSGRVRPDVAIEQLNNGSKVAFAFTGKTKRYGFMPIILHAKGISAIDMRILKRRKIKHQSKEYPIIIARCGDSLKAISKKYL